MAFIIIHRLLPSLAVTRRCDGCRRRRSRRAVTRCQTHSLRRYRAHLFVPPINNSTMWNGSVEKVKNYSTVSITQSVTVIFALRVEYVIRSS